MKYYLEMIVMIKQFEVKNFKCHEENNYFPLPGITIVSGTNNSGKSSLLQSIYLVTQAKSRNYPILSLNEELKLGSFSDILNKNQPNSEAIEFSFTFESELLKEQKIEELIVNVAYKNPNSFTNISLPYFESNPVLYFMEIDFKKENENHETIIFEILDEKNHTIFYKVTGKEDNGFCKIEGIVPESIVYKGSDKKERVICSSNLDIVRNYLKLINSENIKYMKAFRMDDYIDGSKSLKSNLGLSGEYTAEVINKRLNTLTDFQLEEGSEPQTFSKIFDHWISILLGENYRIRSNSLDKDKFKISVQEIKSGHEFSLNQVGFGISQILPIITLLLTSKRDEIILIENPEVHLHPKLQSLFVDLSIFVLENGRKLVIETHSEHIINRLRYRIKQTPSLKEKINILFFEKNEEGIIYSDIEITKEGRLAHWPENFFDQTYNDLLGLIEE
jgi:predicted ATPase